MKCEKCPMEATTRVNSHVFCAKCYENYYYTQPEGCLDWSLISKQVNKIQTPKQKNINIPKPKKRTLW